MIEDRKYMPKPLPKNLGIKDAEDLSDEDLAERLRELPAKSIVDKSTIFKDWDVTNPLPWKPVVDDYLNNPFLPKPFTKLVAEGSFPKDVPILTGINSEEGLILSAPFHKSPKRWDLLFRQWDLWAPQLFFNRETDLVTETDKSCVRQIRERFFPEAGKKNLVINFIINCIIDK